MTVLITTADLIGLYESVAASCEGMPRSLLAAVHETETSFGRGPGDPRRQERSSWMRPSPATRDGDGVVRVDDLEDAVYSAANYLCPNGRGPCRESTLSGRASFPGLASWAV